MKKYPEGVMSSHIHELKVGQSLAIKGPIPKFSYVPNEFEVGNFSSLLFFFLFFSLFLSLFLKDNGY